MLFLVFFIAFWGGDFSVFAVFRRFGVVSLPLGRFFASLWLSLPLGAVSLLLYGGVYHGRVTDRVRGIRGRGI